MNPYNPPTEVIEETQPNPKLRKKRPLRMFAVVVFAAMLFVGPSAATSLIPVVIIAFVFVLIAVGLEGTYSRRA